MNMRICAMCVVIGTVLLPVMSNAFVSAAAALVSAASGGIVKGSAEALESDGRRLECEPGTDWWSPVKVGVLPPFSLPYSFWNVYGVDVELLSDITPRMYGAQLCGFLTGSQSVVGVQGACLGTMTTEYMLGIQASSLFTISKQTVGGVQIGFVVIAQDLYGIQVGVINFAEEANGLQIGLLNRARFGYALQIGLLNMGGNNLPTTTRAECGPHASLSGCKRMWPLVGFAF